MSKKASYIAFSGIDGSGKSTICSRLINYLRSKGFSVCYWWGGLKTYLTTPLFKLAESYLLKNETNKDEPTRYKYKKKELKNSWKNVLYRHSIITDYVIRNKILLSYLERKYDYIICDRYYQDAIIELAAVSNQCDEFIYNNCKKLDSIFPRPIMHFFIDVSPEIAFKRKDDIPSLNYLNIRNEKFKNLLKLYNIKTIDGNSNKSTVLQSVVSKLDV